MKVIDLIEKLQTMPPDAEVSHLWDGAAYTRINFVWLAKSGEVVTADYGQSAYDDEDRPESAPTEKECLYWKTPNKGDE